MLAIVLYNYFVFSLFYRNKCKIQVNFNLQYVSLFSPLHAMFVQNCVTFCKIASESGGFRSTRRHCSTPRARLVRRPGVHPRIKTSADIFTLPQSRLLLNKTRRRNNLLLLPILKSEPSAIESTNFPRIFDSFLNLSSYDVFSFFFLVDIHF